MIAKDELKKPKKDVGYIINLDDSDGPGTHWVCLYNGYYGDSYGVVPPKNIAKWVIHFNEDDFQGLNQESCGYYAVYVLDNMMAGRKAYFGLQPDKYQENERVLKEYFATRLPRAPEW